jgi:hypothetical protein
MDNDGKWPLSSFEFQDTDITVRFTVRFSVISQTLKEANFGEVLVLKICEKITV